jgi:hypothetical protein
MICGLLAAPGAALAQSGALVVAAGEHVVGSVATVAQDIRVEGVVDGDVTSWSGAITIAGSVGGDVVSYGGPVTIAPGGQVAGHVLASSGELRMADGAQVAGQTIRGAGGGDALASLLDVFSPTSASGGGAIGRVLIGAALAVLLLALGWLYNAFWPRRLQIAGLTLQRLAGRAIGLGLISTVALALVLPPLAALLVASVVGVPVLLAVLALVLAAYIYGLAVLARWAGGGLQALDSLPSRALAVAALLVLLIVVATVAQPLYGLALFALLASPGLGAAILCRGGMALPLAAS